MGAGYLRTKSKLERCAPFTEEEGGAIIKRVVKLVEEEETLDFPEPSEISFYDKETSWKVFLLLESTKGMGGWSAPPISGGWLEQPDWLMGDLMMWKYLVQIGENQKREREKQEKDNSP